MYLDLYALETSCRKMINDLINPILTKLSSDREIVVSSNFRNASLENRLSKVEYSMGLSENKPRVFEEIKD